MPMILVLPAMLSAFVLAATAAENWRDRKVAHVERGPFVNEMLADRHRWKDEGVLSVLVRQSPSKSRQPTPLRILDFSITSR